MTEDVELVVWDVLKRTVSQLPKNVFDSSADVTLVGHLDGEMYLLRADPNNPHAMRVATESIAKSMLKKVNS